MQWRGDGPPMVDRGFPKYQDAAVAINSNWRLAPVADDVWRRTVGGRQVCRKWLGDRRGRVLSAGELQHYANVVSGLAEAIEIGQRIDRLIDRHGGWPGAFAADRDCRGG